MTESKFTGQFTCPECGTKTGEREHKCPECGIIRLVLGSLPYHCKWCHCQYNYYKGSDRSQLYCWCCGSVFEQSSIDDYIMKGMDSEIEEEE